MQYILLGPHAEYGGVATRSSISLWVYSVGQSPPSSILPHILFLSGYFHLRTGTETTYRFPYPSKDSTAYEDRISTLWTLIQEDPSTSTKTPIGYVTEPVVLALQRAPVSIKGELTLHRGSRTISCFQFRTEPERSAAVAAVCSYWRENKTSTS